MATMMIPIPGSFISLYILLTKLNLINTRIGYILPQINGGLAMTIFMLKTFFDKMFFKYSKRIFEFSSFDK